MVTIFPERPGDHATVFEVNRRAFPTDAEARLVDRLRGQAEPLVSLVAEAEGRIAGHILFSPVIVSEEDAGRAAGLAPMAVLPEDQRRGIGTALVGAGLDACRDAGYDVVVVLGHADYYPRFGFEPAAPHGLYYEDASFDPYFFVLELTPGALSGYRGAVRYLSAFDMM